MIELTRELFERYLRATGWIFDTGWWIHERASFEHSGRLDVQIASLEDETGVDVRFHLGLCASAERLRARIEMIAPIRGKDLYASDQRLREELWTQHNGLIRAAGIDLKAWEAAR